MARKTRIKCLLAALETTYGTDAIAGGETPVPVKARDTSIEALAGDEQELAYDDGTLGARPSLLTGTHVKLSFKTDLVGAGTAGDPPVWSALMQAALMKLTDGDDDVTLSSDSESNGSLTIYFYQDGTLHALTGSRGSFKLSAKTGEIPSLEWSFTGLFVEPKASALPKADFSKWVRPVPVGNAHSAFTLNGKDIKLIALDTDQSNEVTYQEYVGQQSVEITNFKPSCTIVIEAPAIGDFDPVAIAVSEATDNSFSFQHGKATGNIVQLDVTNIQFGRPSYGDQNGILTWSIPLKLIGENSQLTIK